MQNVIAMLKEIDITLLEGDLIKKITPQNKLDVAMMDNHITRHDIYF